MSRDGWVRVSAKDFLNQKIPTKRVPHKFNKTICHWPYCSQCGLIRLRNKASQKAAEKLCEIDA